MVRVLFVITIGLGVACSSEPAPSRAPVPIEPIDVGATDAGFTLPPPGPEDCRVALAEGLVCACHELGQRPPTLYLLLDRSASMSELVAGRSRWWQVRSALLDRDRGVLRRLGTRISIGAAWFPGASLPSNGDADECDPGREILSTRWGLPAIYDQLEKTLAVSPRGGTPTRAALEALRARVPSLPEPVNVLLATDGAPTCGVGPCAADACTWNLEGRSIGFLTCEDGTNCCDPAKTSGGSRACVDRDATIAAAGELAALGAKVWVLGVPGTVPVYGEVLDAIADAGGTGHALRTDEPEALSAALSSIAARVIDTCTLNLDEPVVDPGVTNVLFDGVPVPQDVVDGWRWSSTSTIELAGAACARIHAGEVGRIQVAVGCRTITR